MNVCFLDFDGPLFPTKVCLYPDNIDNDEALDFIGLNKEFYRISKMDDFAVVALNRLYSYAPFEIVVSSNWANGCSKEVIQNLFDANGITVPLADDYRIADLNLTRLERVNEYIVRNKVKNYIMIDDNESCPDMLNPYLIQKANLASSKLFSVDFDNGISLQNFKDMRTQILKW